MVDSYDAQGGGLAVHATVAIRNSSAKEVAIDLSESARAYVVTKQPGRDAVDHDYERTICLLSGQANR